MSYAIEIAQALAKVLRHAVDCPDAKFAGYAGNRKFWVGETRHCLEVIDGYDDRFIRMRQTSSAFQAGAGHRRTARLMTPSTDTDELTLLRQTIASDLRRFLKRCEALYPRQSNAIARDVCELRLETEAE